MTAALQALRGRAEDGDASLPPGLSSREGYAEAHCTQANSAGRAKAQCSLSALCSFTALIYVSGAIFPKMIKICSSLVRNPIA
jgi:hypothetical protein